MMATATLEPDALRGEEWPEGQDVGDPIHSALQANLAAEFSKRRDFRVYSELDLRLAGHDSRPDLSVYPREPLDFRADATHREDAPALVVEILSTKQNLAELFRRADHLLAAGVKSFWLVTPPLRTVTILLPDGHEERHFTGVVTDPATGVTADLDAVFS